MTETLCDFCKQPTRGRTVRLVPKDPTSRRVALDHNDCYRKFMDLVGKGKTGTAP
jgi:hypothetical protein